MGLSRKMQFHADEIAASITGYEPLKTSLLRMNLANDCFNNVQYLENPTSISLDVFKEQYKQEYQSNILPKIYNGYYDNKNPIHFDKNSLSSYNEPTELQSLFSDNKVELTYTFIALQNDIETLKQIYKKVIPIKTFDYDGKKYTRKQVENLLSKIELELSQINEKVKINDITIFHFFLNLEKVKGKDSKLEVMYSNFF